MVYENCETYLRVLLRLLAKQKFSGSWTQLLEGSEIFSSPVFSLPRNLRASLHTPQSIFLYDRLSHASLPFQAEEKFSGN